MRAQGQCVGEITAHLARLRGRSHRVMDDRRVRRVGMEKQKFVRRWWVVASHWCD